MLKAASVVSGAAAAYDTQEGNLITKTRKIIAALSIFGAIAARSAGRLRV
jgi:hypothetical protein